MKLKDKVAIITGAAAPQGLGYAIATAFANEGAKVAISDINEEGVKERAKELTAGGEDGPGPSLRRVVGRKRPADVR